MRVFVIIISLVFTLLACNTNGNNVVTINKEYTLELPSYMSNNDTLIEGASVQYADLNQNIFCVVIDEPKEEIKESFQSANQWDTTLSYARNYYKYQSLFLSQVYSFSQVYYDTTIIFNNKPSIHFKAESKNESGLTHYQFSFIEGKEDLLMVISWADDKSKDVFRKDFTDILGRLKKI